MKEQSQDNLMKNIRNLFRLKKEHEAINDRIIRDILIKNIRNRFRTKKENVVIKDRLISDINLI